MSHRGSQLGVPLLSQRSAGDCNLLSYCSTGLECSGFRGSSFCDDAFPFGVAVQTRSIEPGLEAGAAGLARVCGSSINSHVLGYETQK